MPMPFYGDEFTFTQPDGSQFKVKGWGNQQQAVFETLNGYTVVKDPVTEYYQYAALSEDGEDLQPTGARPEMVDPVNLGLTASLRINRPAVKALAQANPVLPRGKSRWETRRQIAKRALRAAMGASGIMPTPPQHETVGDYVGLCLLVQFPDVPGTIPREEVEAFCNQKGYNGFGNNGSVYDYFFENSAGKLRYNNVVTPYYTTKHPRAYYTNEFIEMPIRARELIKEALSYFQNHGFDFSGLTSDDGDYVYALNVFYAGNRINNWAKGLWPHSYHLLTPYNLVPGKLAYDYQITDMGSYLTLGTFCHENGHMICDFPDLYDYGYESRGVGEYCLMCAGGSADRKNPTHVCAYLKYRAGWSEKVTSITAEVNLTANAEANEFFIHARDQNEYFIVENRNQAGRDQALPDSGLAIWHVDEFGGDNNNEQMTPELHYECSLIQADGRYDLENGNNSGDRDDLFSAGENDRFADSTQPDSKWWDGTSSGLDIYDIGPAGPTMTFYTNI